jgi:hypothetical protein
MEISRRDFMVMATAGFGERFVTTPVGGYGLMRR